MIVNIRKLEEKCHTARSFASKAYRGCFLRISEACKKFRRRFSHQDSLVIHRPAKFLLVLRSFSSFRVSKVNKLLLLKIIPSLGSRWPRRSREDFCRSRDFFEILRVFGNFQAKLGLRSRGKSRDTKNWARSRQDFWLREGYAEDVSSCRPGLLKGGFPEKRVPRLPGLS